jgi:ubiquinone/menaquinone biosynthesis C-methylase UbiE
MPEEILHPELPEPDAQIAERLMAERQALLDEFATHPENGDLWDTAYTWVRAEGDSADYNGVASDIPAEELINMANIVRATDVAKRYDLMAQYTTNKRLWFDVIEGFGTETIRQALKETVEASGQSFYRTLDLGTGVGKSLDVLEQFSSQAVGLDRNQALLTVAKQRAGENTTLVRAEVSKMPFEDSSFDLVSSLGVEGSLDKPTKIAFYTELARVIMRGGVYISAYTNYPYLPSEFMTQITQTSKAMLADMIGDTVTGGLSITEILSEDEQNALLANLGLSMELFLDSTNDAKNQTIIQIVTKEL